MFKKVESLDIQSEKRRAFRITLIATITIVAAFLRLYKLGEWSFWIDEVTSIKRAIDLGSTVNFLAYSHPLFYLLIKPIILIGGTSEWNVRLLPALIGVISIPLLYLPIRKMFSVPVALISLAIISVSPWHIYWSQNARFYILLLLLFNLALLTYFFGLETGNSRYFILSGLFIILALASHASALLFFPTILIYSFLVRVLPFEKPQGLKLRKIGIFVGVLLAGWILTEAYRVSSFQSGTTPNLTTRFLGFSNNSPFWLLGTLGYYVTVPIICLALFGAIYLLVKVDRRGLFLIVGAAVPVMTIVSLSPFSFTASRYFFVALPSFVILCALATEELVLNVRKYGKLLVVGVIFLIFAEAIGQDILYYTYQKGNRDDWKGAFAFVEEQKEAGDLVVSTRPLMAEYYLGEEALRLNSTEPMFVVESGKRAWFVIDMSWIIPTWQEWIDENLMLVKVLDVHVAARNFVMRVYLYDPTRSPTRPET